ncbi:MAG TPA: nuclear transport factor 2 family protein [Ramlibacter sp.]|uniref:nuclear transport factor 2 family protein n=1 Tax=Ramlibacter sp. TaxID=1917967 RepID=UPI002C823738|nr:nuclear transport factor 2 family protein [Ramlibacter sp.]HVZ45490.1 nuclear transport factor 2 family protein [Ramlibacter sp.]
MPIVAPISAKDVEQQLVTREEQRRAALLASDLSRIGEIYDDRLFYRHANSRVDDKTSFMDNFAHIKYESLEASDMSVHLAGDTAIVSVAERVVVKRDGVKRQFHVLAMNVWMRESASAPWRFLARQATFDPKAPGVVELP